MDSEAGLHFLPGSNLVVSPKAAGHWTLTQPTSRVAKGGIGKKKTVEKVLKLLSTGRAAEMWGNWHHHLTTGQSRKNTLSLGHQTHNKEESLYTGPSLRLSLLSGCGMAEHTPKLVTLRHETALTNRIKPHTP